ncbi:MAG: hypothetical protein PUK05_03570 [Peptoniphilaceae bacterium]|nr:hypothetical protein [Peptoniphilaceae bacterium]MDY5765883.1 hypothetical protein [Peptoniphilaceae bacterium]
MLQIENPQGFAQLEGGIQITNILPDDGKEKSRRSADNYHAINKPTAALTKSGRRSLCPQQRSDAYTLTRRRQEGAAMKHTDRRQIQTIFALPSKKAQPPNRPRLAAGAKIVIL